MATLFVLSGPDIGRTFEVDDGAVVGRGDGCAVRVRDGSVSRRHARLERDESGWAVVDLGSRNGLRGPGGRVERLPLEDGDTFHLGELELRFREEVVEAPRADAGALDTLTLEAPPAPAPPPPPPPAPAEDPLDVDEIVLEDPDEPLAPPPPREARPAAGERPSAAGERAAAARAAKEAELAKARARAAKGAGGGAPARAGSGGGQLRAEVAREVLQYSRVADRQGFFGSDLAQQPAWVKGLVALVALAFAAAVFLLAFRGTSLLKGRAQADDLPVEAYEEPE